MEKKIIDECYEVFGYDEDYYVLANSYYFYDIKLAEEEARKYLESGEYAHVVIRNAVDWEYSL